MPRRAIAHRLGDRAERCASRPTGGRCHWASMGFHRSAIERQSIGCGRAAGYRLNPVARKRSLLIPGKPSPIGRTDTVLDIDLAMRTRPSS